MTLERLKAALVIAKSRLETSLDNYIDNNGDPLTQVLSGEVSKLHNDVMGIQIMITMAEGGYTSY